VGLVPTAGRGAAARSCPPGTRGPAGGPGPADTVGYVRAPVAARLEPATMLQVVRRGVSTVLVRADRYFDREGVYGTASGAHSDNAERFVFFCRAVLEWVRTLDPPPDVLHLHDWPAALTAAFLRGTPGLYPELREVRTIFTVHNLAYQGRFWRHDWHLLNLDPRL